MIIHAFKPRHITANNIPDPNRQHGLSFAAKKESRITCDRCGGSRNNPIHFTPKATNHFA